MTINKVHCGDCGKKFAHPTDKIIISCPHCGYTSEPCDFPDQEAPKEFHVTKENFIEWYFGGSDQEQKDTLLTLGKHVKKYLETESGYHLDLQHLFEESDYTLMPISFTEEKDEIEYPNKKDDLLCELDFDWTLSLIKNKSDRTLYEKLGDAFRPVTIDER